MKKSLFNIARLVCFICTFYQAPPQIQPIQGQTQILHDRMSNLEEIISGLEAENKALKQQIKELQETIPKPNLREKYYQEIASLISKFCTESGQDQIHKFTRNLMHNILPPEGIVVEFEEDFIYLQNIISTFNAILENPNQHPNLRNIIEDLLELDCDFFKIIYSCKGVLGNIQQHWSSYYKKVLDLQDIKYVPCMQTCYESVQKRFGHPLFSLVRVSEQQDILLSGFASQFHKTQPMLSMLLAKIQNMPVAQNDLLADEVHDILKLYIRLDRIFKDSMLHILKPMIKLVSLRNEELGLVSPKHEESVLKWIQDGVFQITPNGLKINGSVKVSEPGISTKLAALLEQEDVIYELVTVEAKYLDETPITIRFNVVVNPCYFKFEQSSVHRQTDRWTVYTNSFNIYNLEKCIGTVSVLTIKHIVSEGKLSVNDLVGLISPFKPRIWQITCLKSLTEIDPTKYPESLTLNQTLFKIMDDMSNPTPNISGDTSHPDPTIQQDQ